MVDRENDDSVSRKTKLPGKYNHLRALLRLHKNKVKKNMHRAMSPISAMSGYLDLMEMALQNEIDAEKIEQYRTKIDQGVDELGEIIEELYSFFNDESSSKDNSKNEDFSDLEMHHNVN